MRIDPLISRQIYFLKRISCCSLVFFKYTWSVSGIGVHRSTSWYSNRSATRRIFLSPPERTQSPVSPSKVHPWNGHSIHVSCRTLPPTPKFAPIWAQYAWRTYGTPFLPRNRTTSRPQYEIALTSPGLRSQELITQYHPINRLSAS